MLTSTSTVDAHSLIIGPDDGAVVPGAGMVHKVGATHLAGQLLIMEGVIQPGQQAFFDREIAPHIDGDRVRFVGEVGGAAKQSLFAHARGLLMPIRWAEPFGMVNFASTTSLSWTSVPRA